MWEDAGSNPAGPVPFFPIPPRPEDDSSLPVHVFLGGSERAMSPGDRAVRFHGTHVRGGKAADPFFDLGPYAGRDPFRAAGTVEEPAERCAAWFGTS